MSKSDDNTTLLDKVPNLQAAIPALGPKEPTLPDLTGRVAVITGGALGIGYEVARALCKKGCRCIVMNRKEEQGDEAIKSIKEEVGQHAQIEWKQLDLGELKVVKENITALAEKEERLDFLVLSSGINSNQYGEDNDGIDRHFGVNWLGHFYMINLLWPLLRKTSKMPNTPAPRVCFESSEMHRMAPKDCHFGSLEEINDSGMDPMAYYGRTKLAMILGARFGLYEKVIKKNHDNILVTSVHPGAVATSMQEQWQDAYPGLIGKAAEAVSLLSSRSPEQGAYSALWALTSEDIVKKDWNGHYFPDPEKEGGETAQAQDRNLGLALWDLSTRLVKEKLGKDALASWDA